VSSASRPTVKAPALAQLADALVGLESSQSMLTRLEELLAGARALPARLFLFDGSQRVFFPAAGLGCEREHPELPAPDPDQALPPGHHALCSRGEWVGLLQVLAEQPYDVELVEQLCALLGPTLIAIHRQETTVAELRLVQEESAQFISAGGLLRHLDVEVLLVKILELVMSAVRAEVGAVLTVDDEGEPRLRVALGLREEHLAAIRVRGGKRVTESVLEHGQVMCFDHGQVESLLDLSGLGANLTALLALPLTTRDRNQGVVVLGNPEAEFGDSQRRIAETVCGMAAIALDNALLVKSTLDRERLKREMDLAHSVQEQMYPVGGLALGRLRVEGGSRPCDETGGDYYSFLARGGQAVAMIGDVSGHGLGAALYTTMAHAIIQQQLRAGAALEPGFVVLNEALFHTQSGRFMTAALVAVDPATLDFTYVSAGHNPLLWINRGEPRWLESCGMPLGIVPEGAFPPPSAARLEPGDYLILYTDGFTEAVNRDGGIYGEERLAAIARRGWEAQLGPQELMLLITADVDEWASGHRHEDDLTMVVIAVGP
jgi:sigma-B regulation protein RsbU (phosphoserine phosphatase)